VCGIFCATANPVEVVVAETEQGRGIMGVIDGVKTKGIETAAELTVLHDLGIDHGQGFHLARPGPPDALRKAAREGAARIDQDLRAAAPLTAVAS